MIPQLVNGRAAAEPRSETLPSLEDGVVSAVSLDLLVESNKLGPGQNPPPAALEGRGSAALEFLCIGTPHTVQYFLLNEASFVDIFIHFNLMPTFAFQKVFFNSSYEDISTWKKKWSLD